MKGKGPAPPDSAAAGAGAGADDEGDESEDEGEGEEEEGEEEGDDALAWKMLEVAREIWTSAGAGAHAAQLAGAAALIARLAWACLSTGQSNLKHVVQPCCLQMAGASPSGAVGVSD